MHVFDHIHRRGRATQRNAVHQGGEPATTSIWIDERRRHSWVADAEQILQQEEVVRLHANEPRPQVCACCLVIGVLAVYPERAPQQPRPPPRPTLPGPPPPARR